MASSGATPCCWSRELQREGSVVNLVAHEVRPLADVAAKVGGRNGRRHPIDGARGDAPAVQTPPLSGAGSGFERMNGRPDRAAAAAGARRFGFDMRRKRRYQAADAAKNMPNGGDVRNA